MQNYYPGPGQAGQPPRGRRGDFQEIQLAYPPGFQPPPPTNSPAGSSTPGYNRQPLYEDYDQLESPRPSGYYPSSRGGGQGGYPQQAAAYPGYPAQQPPSRRTPNISQQAPGVPGGYNSHAVVSRMQREHTMTSSSGAAKSEFEQPKYDANVELAFETFYHQDGSQYTCTYKNRERLVVDPATGKTQPFPTRWYKEGILVTDQTVLTEQSQPTQAVSSEWQSTTNADDRGGFIEHPKKGRIQTYIYEEKRNVHKYFDKSTGEWIPLPIEWELHSKTTRAYISQIQEALPDWKDQFDMLAALRASNYSAEDCIGHYFTIGDVSALGSTRSAKDGELIAKKDKLIRELCDKMKTLESEKKTAEMLVEQEQFTRLQAEANASECVEQSSALAAQLSQVRASLLALQRERAGNRNRGGSAVDREAVVAAAMNTKNLHKEHLKLRQQVQHSFADLQQLLVNVSSGMSRIPSNVNSGESAELIELKELYRREALQRKLLYNQLLELRPFIHPAKFVRIFVAALGRQLQELRGNIRVFCRCRPDNRAQCALQFLSDTEVLPPGAKKPFTFDKIFTTKSTQEEVYADTQPIIQSCVDGYNVCILAYGQTGSGKTHTMQGPPDDPGVNTRSITDLLEICQHKENVDYTLTASMIEIYNETIHDLLSSQVNQLEIRGTQGNKIILPGMIEMNVTSVRDIDKIMKLGSKNRATAATKMNSTSSRSHLIFMITVKGVDRATGSVSTGMLTLCDLAGSERVSKSEATGQRLVEAASINKSLSSLGQVFTALKTGQLHIPYRNSKLTHVLQPCLGGDAKACLFVMTSPDVNNTAETISTLQFGSNAQQVALGQAKRHVARGPPIQ